jgi:hypothetical protein
VKARRGLRGFFRSAMLDTVSAFRSVSEKPDQAQCSETFGRRTERFVAMAEGSKCEAHFLNVRREELNRVADAGTSGAIRDLKEMRRKLKSSPVGTEFLDVWIRALAS